MGMEVFKSVGIDIGTSTSKMIISELVLGRISSHFSLPHYDIVERKVTYESEIISTPLIGKEEINLPKLISWLELEYERASLSFSEIKSGAVIITGETAIKKNADQIIHYLAERSGDFVVAIAGASLEGVLAARGSGAYEYSKTVRGTVANIDIGGGTANAVILQKGKVLQTITFHVGGRLIEIDKDGKVLSVSSSIRPWLDYRDFSLVEGSSMSFEELSLIAETLCFDMLDVIAGRQTVLGGQSLIHSSSCQELPKIDEVMISGGVGKLTVEKPPASLRDISQYNDIGPLIASKLVAKISEYPFHFRKASQTSRATVIGAGMQSTKISGATISIQPKLLPLRNIPVIKVQLLDMQFETVIEKALLNGRELFGDQEQLPFAIGLAGNDYIPYLKIKELAKIIDSLYQKHFPMATILAVVCESDMAKALGQSLKLFSSCEVICIDQVVIDEGNYIDIGEPFHDTMVPVVVKTLAFS